MNKFGAHLNNIMYLRQLRGDTSITNTVTTSLSKRCPPTTAFPTYHPHNIDDDPPPVNGSSGSIISCGSCDDFAGAMAIGFREIQTTKGATGYDRYLWKFLVVVIMMTTILSMLTPLVQAGKSAETPVGSNQPPIGLESSEPAGGTPLQVPEAPAPLTESQQHALFDNSYIVDNKRFSELMDTRCYTSTIMVKPKEIEPSFWLIAPKREIKLGATCTHHEIIEAGYDPHKRTIVFIHGFTQKYPGAEWLTKIRELFRRLGKVHTYNLIIMDWGKGAGNPFFTAAANTHGMGTFLAVFLQRLLDLGANRMEMHLVGHSLGAHVAGFAGKRIRPRLGRISALDAAGPCYGKLLNGPFQLKLGPDDAHQVDVHHYDDGFLGLGGQNGQFDIYVNGGSGQPGCTDVVRTMMSAAVTYMFSLERALSESHTRSTVVPTCELNSRLCQQVAYECSSYDDFLAGECGQCDDFNNQCFLMSFDFQFEDMDLMPIRTSRPGKKMYINTNDKENFCLQHYQVILNMKDSSWFRQRFQLELVGENGKLYELEMRNHKAENVITGLLTFTGVATQFVGANILADNTRFSSVWRSNSHPIDTIEVNFMSSIFPKVRKALSSKLCPSKGTSEETSNELQGTDSFQNHFSKCFT